MHIRDATADDADAIDAIYHHYVEHSTCTFQLTPNAPGVRRAWLAAHGERHPVLVAEDDGRLAGWASLSAWNPREAYARSVENSIYLRHDARGRGLGTRLLGELLDRARAAGHHTVIAGVSGDQDVSLRLHERAGFTPCARLREVGFKFGRWIDVVYLQKLL